jgi:hypothetical protein
MFILKKTFVAKWINIGRGSFGKGKREKRVII